MPTKIRKRGENSYELCVSSGYDGQGKQVLHRKTVVVEGKTEEAKLRAAEKQYALFLGEVQRGQVATSGKMTLGQFYDYWKTKYAAPNHQAGTIVYNDSMFSRIRTALGQLRLDKIEPKHLLAFYENLAEPGIRKDPNEGRKKTKKDSSPEPPPTQEAKEKKPKLDTLSALTIKKHHVLINTLLNQAVKWNLIPYNPASRVEAPKAKASKKEVYDDKTTGEFLKALEGQETKHRLMCLLALTGGLCKEEIFGIEWRDIDFSKGTVNIDRASIYVSGQGIITKDCKNTHRHRIVSLPPATIQLLKQQNAEQAAKREKLGGTATNGGKWAGPEDPGNDRVFTAWNGAPAHPDSFYTWLRKFTDKTGLPPISPHTFRHMAATYLITSGTDIKTVSGKLGHSLASTTMNVYAHLMKSAEKKTANTMQNILDKVTAKATPKGKKKKQAK